MPRVASTPTAAGCGRGSTACRSQSRRTVMSQRELYSLSRAEIRAYTRTSSFAGAWAIASTWAIIAATLAALARWPHPLTFVLAVVILGGRQLALAVIMHDAAHGTLFRGKRDLLVDLTCAAPVWSDTARYRRHHLGHHAHTGTAKDPDLGLAPERPMSRGSLARKIARDLSGIVGVRRLIFLVRNGVVWRPLATNALLALA